MLIICMRKIKHVVLSNEASGFDLKRIYLCTLCVRTGMPQTRNEQCACSHEPSLIAFLVPDFSRDKSLTYSASTDPEDWTGGGGLPPPPEKSQKYRVSKQYWPGPPEKSQKYWASINVRPLSARQQNAMQMAFRWRADDGPLIVVCESSSLPSSTIKTLSKLDPLWQNFLDPRMFW